MPNCNLCPRNCNIDRSVTHGYCLSGTSIKAARAGLHFWEEPCISGLGGSGAVFFSGCNLRCIYCQNKEISCGGVGAEITVTRLRKIFDELIFEGADNINLVTPTHFSDIIASALSAEKLPVPVVYNTGSYEKVSSLKKLEGLIDIYLPDYKYASGELAALFSGAKDYPETAMEAIKEMYRQTGDYVFDEDGMLKNGVMVRHLILPGHIENTLDVIDRVSDCFSNKQVLFSLMSQYTPPKEKLKFLELNRRLTEQEYSRAVDYMYLCGIENGYVQDLSSAKEEYTPSFDLTGILSGEY